MHVVFRERHGLEETDSPADPGQTPADLAVLSYSDSELASFAAAYEAAEAGGGSAARDLRDGGARDPQDPHDDRGSDPTAGPPEHPGPPPGATGAKRRPTRHPADESTDDAAHSLDRRGAAPAPSLETQAPANVRASPTLLLANLSLLRHPLSVDHYLDVTLSGAKGILVRLIGGAAYWEYGLTQLSRLARERGIALAVLPADGRADPALDAASTLPAPLLAKLRTLCETGGIAASREALEVMAEAAGLGGFKPPAPALSGEGNQASAREEQNPTDGTAAAEADGAASTPSAATDAMPLSSNIAEHSPGNAALSPATEPASSSTEPLPHEIGERSPGNAAGSPGADPADGRAALMSESITRQLSSVEDGSASPVPPLTPTVTAPMAAQAAPVAAAPATKNAAPTSSQRGAPHPATDSTLSPTPRPTAPAAPKALPLAGAWDQSAGTAACAAAFHLAASRPRAVIVFYRAWAAAGDLAAIEALSGALEAEGFDALGLYVPSLKADEA
ncbi:MAG: hypothetical protein Q4F71_11420, partial [Paracoccus sp. (in: a-proteobacteria)]|nr:hypothetical protein [Paracoccus sp. (in: a-proteobacteria)]